MISTQCQVKLFLITRSEKQDVSFCTQTMRILLSTIFSWRRPWIAFARNGGQCHLPRLGPSSCSRRAPSLACAGLRILLAGFFMSKINFKYSRSIMTNIANFTRGEQAKIKKTLPTCHSTFHLNSRCLHLRQRQRHQRVEQSSNPPHAEHGQQQNRNAPICVKNHEVLP